MISTIIAVLIGNAIFFWGSGMLKAHLERRLEDRR